MNNISLHERIRQIVAAAPPLSPGVRTRIRALLLDVPVGAPVVDVTDVLEEMGR